MIRLEAAMPTSRFVMLIGVPERSYRRWQQRQGEGRPVKGPWPAPEADRIEPVVVAYADRFPAWGVGRPVAVDAHQHRDLAVPARQRLIDRAAVEPHPPRRKPGPSNPLAMAAGQPGPYKKGSPSHARAVAAAVRVPATRRVKRL